MKNISTFVFVLLAIAFVGPVRVSAFYGSCSTPQSYFFAPVVTYGMTALDIYHSLDDLKAQGVNVEFNTSPSPQLFIFINASADHILNVDFIPSNANYSSVQVSITDQFGNSASRLGGSSMTASLAAAGLAAGIASGRRGLGAASLAAGAAALGLGLFGPGASAADSSKCPTSWVNVTLYIPGSVKNYTINRVQPMTCYVPYFFSNVTNDCSICYSRFNVSVEGATIQYPCKDKILECCPGEQCITYELYPGKNMTKCCLPGYDCGSAATTRSIAQPAVAAPALQEPDWDRVKSLGAAAAA